MGSITGINWSASAAVPNGSSCPALTPTTTITNQMNKVVSKPYRLKNYCSQTENYDTLHRKVAQDQGCGVSVCKASIWYLNLVKNPLGPANPLLSAEEERKLLGEAQDFLSQYYTSIKRLDTASHLARWDAVQREVRQTGTYELTETELTFGAKLAWRNASRCIGRIQWAKLQVFDARHVTTAQGMFEAICTQIKYATNKGNIRSSATIFAQRKPGQTDFRVWNSQIISYAGYRTAAVTEGNNCSTNSTGIIGDPGNVEFTEVCQKLGWRGAGTEFDVLPLVLQAGNCSHPEMFEIPKELILEVQLQHPSYDWFALLGLKWYAVPAVSGMAFDCGGLLFTACPFNGWYMSTEIGARNLGDPHRYNKLEVVAKKMRLDTSSPATLWKDRAVIEINAAVLYSFQKQTVSIVDHHTAAESFMKHYETEMRLRGGCPAEWIWVVPPISGSLTPVFHQEMVYYTLKPSWEHQEPAYKNYQWDQEEGSSSSSSSALSVLGIGGKSGGEGRRTKYRFKEVARAVKFTSNLFGKALQRRIKATILYATETGKSEKYAKLLAELFNHAFNAEVMCMADYDVMNLEHEALVMIVTSTFGNGEGPENGEGFAREVKAMKENNLHDVDHAENFQNVNCNNGDGGGGGGGPLCREQSLRTFSAEDQQQTDSLGKLSNVRFAVFALGSSAYPNFCAFGIFIDGLLESLGGERISALTTGDELNGQEQAFKSWAPKVFHTACETFCLEDDVNIDDASATLRSDSLTSDTIRFMATEKAVELAAGLSRTHSKNVFACPTLFSNTLALDKDGRKTIHVGLLIGDDWSGKASYQPGDHVGVFAVNREEVVKGLMSRLALYRPPLPQGPIQLQILIEQKDGGKVWKTQERLPPCDLRTLLSRYVDIAAPASQAILALLAAHALADADKKRLQLLATDSQQYENWKHWGYKNLLETLQEFPSVSIDAAVLISQLPLIQPRFYSISSSPLNNPNQVDITAAVIEFKTEGGKGPVHYGLCSHYMDQLDEGDPVYCFFRSAPNFHLPTEITRPVIMVGPGTGVAPFRGFWQQKKILQSKGKSMGPMLLFSGYRSADSDLHATEKAAAVEAGILDYAFLALSRSPPLPKTYVQDKLLEAAPMVHRMLASQNGHFYVCGDCRMAEDVADTLRVVFQKAGGLSLKDSDALLTKLRKEKRYQEDIFGITYRAPDVINNRTRTSLIENEF